MTGDWRALNILGQRELEFQFEDDPAMVCAMGRSTGQSKDDEQPRGSASWDAVRVSKVKRARALVRDSNYPSKQTLDAVADLLARNLGAGAGRSKPK